MSKEYKQAAQIRISSKMLILEQSSLNKNIHCIGKYPWVGGLKRYVAMKTLK